MAKTFTISIDYEQFDHKPSSKLQYKDVVDKFGNPRTEASVIGARLGSEIETLNLTKLAKKISRGQTWSPYVFNVCPDWRRRRRLEGLFASCEVFALDFDNNETVDNILSKANSLGVEISLIHTSFSSSAEYLKHRAIILTSDPITDFELTKKISIGLAYAFDSDKACVDTARLYYGSTPQSIVYINKEVVNMITTLEKIADDVDATKYLTKQKLCQSKPDEAIWGNSQIQKEIWDKLPKNKLNSIKRKVRGLLLNIKNYKQPSQTTTGGSRYECVWKTTSAIARMPEITGAACHEWVMAALQSNSAFDNWDKDADAVVRSAIEWSANHADDPI